LFIICLFYCSLLVLFIVCIKCFTVYSFVDLLFVSFSCCLR